MNKILALTFWTGNFKRRLQIQEDNKIGFEEMNWIFLAQVTTQFRL